jgi:hypothetical protein
VPVSARRDLVSVLLLVFVCFGCRSYIAYHGQPLASVESAKKAIYQTLEQQPGGAAPLGVEVTDEKFRLTQMHWNPVAGSGAVGTTIYYAQVGDMVLSEKRGLFAVTIKTTTGYTLLHVYAVDQHTAERFIDALETMRKAAATVAAEP